LKATPTEAPFPSEAAPSKEAASATIPVSATDELPKTAEGTPEPPAAGQAQEAETPLAFTATPTEYVVNPNLTPSAVVAENATFLGKHVVQSYDSLESIARAYGVDPAAIKAANNLPSDAVTPGSTLVIPAVKWLNETAGPMSIPQFPPMYQNAGFSK
jgi:LysM repeat protein